MCCQVSRAYEPLNAIQKVMLHWSSFHPYNATHVCKIAGPLHVCDLAEAVTTTFRRYGLGIAHLSADGQQVRHEADIRPEVEAVVCGDDPGTTVEEHLTSALNRSFGRPTSHPFRFTAIDVGPQSHYVILAYDHWVADGRAGILVLRNVLGRYLTLSIPAGVAELHTGTCRDVVPWRLTVWDPAAGQRNRNWFDWRGTYRSNRQLKIDYRLYHTIPGTAARLQEFARGAGGKVIDVLLAAFGRAVTEVTPYRSRPNRLALANIVESCSTGDDDLALPDAWMNDDCDVILDYYRGVSTGPDTPIVLSPTTFREHLNIGVSYRTTEFPRASIDAIMEMFRAQIEQPNKALGDALRRLPWFVPSCCRASG